eukprot:CAMPEP_0206616220 /NCGR_PEP_ID=MMETSP0325_2-20121206/58845_1 /ASSEMBLY_ACC=CAM_ASM_000347 /TAXON_ID=2866 /ORGANISM="Crypthecodinium cohnii, Strain Seligo" /LENGTH=78 /DNA_ID=CAMNT_0054137841 /DNA_START=31 /DNA_END=264 /DNA_ORIENTATION=-
MSQHLGRWSELGNAIQTVLQWPSTTQLSCATAARLERRLTRKMEYACSDEGSREQGAVRTSTKKKRGQRRFGTRGQEK